MIFMEISKDEALQERLKNMSPEELMKLQKQRCIFCHIIEGKVEAKKIYEDDKVLAILDINPANPGHILLLPKEHYMILPQMPDDLIEHLFMVVKALSHLLLRILKAQGTNIFVANGLAAGQRAQHFMIHIIPRKEGDGLNFDLPENRINEDELMEIGKVLREKLGFKANSEKLEEKKEKEASEKDEKEKAEELKENKIEKKVEKGEKGEEKSGIKTGNKKVSLDDISELLIGKKDKKG